MQKVKFDWWLTQSINWLFEFTVLHLKTNLLDNKTQSISASSTTRTLMVQK